MQKAGFLMTRLISVSIFRFSSVTLNANEEISSEEKSVVHCHLDEVLSVQSPNVQPLPIFQYPITLL